MTTDPITEFKAPTTTTAADTTTTTLASQTSQSSLMTTIPSPVTISASVAEGNCQLKNNYLLIIHC